MNAEDLDRLLLEERTITPSADFGRRVMRGVRQTAREREGLVFPWRRAIPGLAACALLIVVGIALALRTPPDPVVVDLARHAALVQGCAWMLAALLGSYSVVRASMRLAGYRR